MLKKIKIIIWGFLGILSYTIIFYVLRIGLKYIPDLILWGNYKPILNIFSISLSLVDIVYFLFGMLVTTHGVINLLLITKENHKAQNMKTRKPEKLITTGFYSKARHPMYGTFMIINMGLFFSSRSFWGIIIVILFFIIQHISTNYEEKNELAKIFGKDYEIYTKNVSKKFFLPVYKVYISISIILTISGLVFLLGSFV